MRRVDRVEDLLGPVHVLGISWGGFLGLMYGARYPGSVRSLAVVGASASRDFVRRADENAHRRATSERTTARCPAKWSFLKSWDAIPVGWWLQPPWRAAIQTTRRISSTCPKRRCR